jgi:very-short-patch-repair endonuclease
MQSTAAIKDRAKELRHSLTPAEQTLWNRLRRKQFHGLKFRRKRPLGPFIVDFMCNKCKLVIEIDGDRLTLQETDDQAETALLKAQGYTVLRFASYEVLHQLDDVLAAIAVESGVDL